MIASGVILTRVGDDFSKFFIEKKSGVRLKGTVRFTFHPESDHIQAHSCCNNPEIQLGVRISRLLF